MRINELAQGKILRAFGLFVLSYFLLSIVLYFSTPFLSRLMLPFLEFATERVSMDYDVRNCYYEKNPDRITFDVDVNRMVSIPSKGKRYESFSLKESLKSEIIGIHFLLLFSLLSVWPGLLPKERIRLFLILIPVLVFLTSFDAAFTLRGRIEGYYNALVSGEAISTDHYSAETGFADHMLIKGGRHITSLAVFFVSLYLVRKKSKLPVIGVERNSSCPCGSGRKYKKCCMKNVS